MPEIIDICDEEGHLTGETMARSEVHRLELWHRSAIVWVINSRGEILIQQRAEHLGAFPGRWDVSMVGHVVAGEEPTPTAVRELHEELGIEAEPHELHFVDTNADRFMLEYGKMHHEYDFVFTLHKDIAVEDLKLQAAEVLTARWITPNELEREMRETPRLFSTRRPRVYEIALAAARDQSRTPVES